MVRCVSTTQQHNILSLNPGLSQSKAVDCGGNSRLWWKVLLVGVVGVLGVAGIGMPIADAPPSDADVFDTIVVLWDKRESRESDTCLQGYKEIYSIINYNNIKTINHNNKNNKKKRCIALHPHLCQYNQLLCYTNSMWFS